MIPRPLVPLALLAIVLASAACSAPPAASAPAPASAMPSQAAGSNDCPTAQPDPLPAGESRLVTIATELGSMTLTIEADLSPIAAGNFVTLAGCGFYDGVVFHRVVPGFVIQGGDPTGTGTGGPGYTIKDEPVTTPYSRGIVAMARTPAPDSVGSQFFIVLDDEARAALESANTYQIIGTVTAGMETADAIVVAANGVELPSDPVVMTDVSVAP
jgi:cyclophilin family peptidyl-prolyl cis-trans isomerase